MNQLRSPIFSVIIPTKDRSCQIADAIDSVRSQLVEDWEIIIVDDGSSNAEFETARRIAALDPRISFFFHTHRMNLGPGASRNLGIEMATGRFVVFLDSDDVLEEHAFESFCQAFFDHPSISVVYGKARLIGDRDDGTVFGEGLPGVPVRLFSQLAHWNVVQTGAVSVRRDVFGFYPFPPEMPNSQDWACWLKLAANMEFIFLDRVLVTLRTQRESITGHGLSTIKAHCRYTVIQAEFLRGFARSSRSPEEQLVLFEGLRWRSTECLLRSLFNVRRLTFFPAVRWFLTWLRVARKPGVILASIAETLRYLSRIGTGDWCGSFIIPADGEHQMRSESKPLSRDDITVFRQ